jgi:hypothetical protein
MKIDYIHAYERHSLDEANSCPQTKTGSTEADHLPGQDPNTAQPVKR